MPFGLSLHSLVSSVGADAGFAAIVGLAILVLLYFAHARETDSLREQAAVLSERLQQAEAKLAQMRRGQPAATAPDESGVVPPPPGRAPATGAAQAAAQRPQPAPAAAQAMPAAPAGVGAPALAAATRFVPAGAARPESLPATPGPASPQPAPAAAPQPAVAAPRPEPAVAALRRPAPSAPAPEPGGEAGAAPAPATAAGAANGGRERGGAAVATAPVATPPPPSVGPRRASGRPAPRPTGRSSRSLPPIPPQRRSSATGRRVIVALGALIVVGVVAGLLIATSGGGSTNASSATTPASNAPSANPTPAAAAAPAFNPSSVTVAVLNGTSTNNLAHTVAAKLVSGGYKQGPLATASDQTRTKTTVAYLPGHRDAAQHVASALKLQSSAVTPVDSSTQAIACPPPNPCSAQVIVTVGSDLATL
jgi:LytR cell envelope-related transcriptional attenuator